MQGSSSKTGKSAEGQSRPEANVFPVPGGGNHQKTIAEKQRPKRVAPSTVPGLRVTERKHRRKLCERKEIRRQSGLKCRGLAREDGVKGNNQQKGMLPKRSKARGDCTSSERGWEVLKGIAVQCRMPL